MKTRWKIWYITYKRPIQIISPIVFIVLFITLWWLFYPVYDPVPTPIRHQINFTVLYPSGYNINSSSWQYTSSQGLLAYTVQVAGITVNFTEQTTPLPYQNDIGAYDRFIGSLKPFANFSTPFGTASIVDFVTATDFQIEGETGILNAKGTFLLVHPNSDLSNNQWSNLFDTLKASQ
jgi:hypothetical protein